MLVKKNGQEDFLQACCHKGDRLRSRWHRRIGGDLQPGGRVREEKELLGTGYHQGDQEKGLDYLSKVRRFFAKKDSWLSLGSAAQKKPSEQRGLTSIWSRGSLSGPHSLQKSVGIP